MAQASYASIAELIEQYDERLLEQLGSDTGTPLAIASNDDYGILANAIERGSAEIETYALRGERYTVADLEALEAADDWALKGLACDLAMAHLFIRRGATAPPDIRDRIEAAKQTLADLRDGKLVFNSAAHHAAGKASIVVMPAATRGRLNMVSDTRYFPRRRTETL